MKIHNFSIVVGDSSCNMNCPFCVSKMTCTRIPDDFKVRWDRFKTAMEIAKQAADGLISVKLTSTGEPLLFPSQIRGYLDRLNGIFPLIELQTNGLALSWIPKGTLTAWSQMGLSLMCVSVTHHDPQISTCIMRGPLDYNYWDSVKRIQDAGLSCRLNCTMVKGGCDRIGEVDQLICKCKHRGVDQLTIRCVAKPAVTKMKGPFDWVCANQSSLTECELYDHLDTSGTELLRLPHGASVFDVGGQNVCVGNCLTRTTDPNDIRQLIFFPDGKLMYDWQYPGARIL
jgi:molybdenum cofactor biosynthesis enzyme MoaA